jgi:hypothetical protein
MPGMTMRYVKSCCAAAMGSLLLLAAGCGSDSEEFQTLSTEQAEQIEQARRDRAQQAETDRAMAAADQTDEAAAAPTGANSAAATSGSPLVLAAAQTAAAAVRQRGVESSFEAVADPWATPSTERQQRGGAPGAAGQSSATSRVEAPDDVETETGLDSPVAVAASRAAGAVQGEQVKREIQLLIPERSFSVEGPDDAVRISYDDFDLLKVLNMEPVPVDAVDYFPDWLKNLDGKRVRVRGFMYPTFQETDIPGFVLARDNQICCFGRNPKIYDLVEVTLAPGVTTDYIQGRPFDVVGQFHIRPEADGGELWQLYQMTDAIVIDK